MARLLTRRTALLMLAGGLAKLASARAQPARERSSKPIVIEEVRIFDGVADRLKPGHVLVSDRKIQRVSSAPIAAPAGSTVIRGRGRVLMPGLTDAHWHMTLAANTLAALERPDPGLLYANTVAEAHRTLQRGFTTVRDMAGPTFGLKDAIDAGVVPGPRVYPSGAMISQTAGHGDFAPPHVRPPTLGGRPSHLEDLGGVVVVNGVPEVLAAVRQQLKSGASQIKLAVGGGVISRFDPIDTLAFTPDELRAAVQAAGDWGTYVAVHVYTPAGIRRALEAGVRSIEHAHLADEPSIRLIAEKGAWLSTQPFEPSDLPLPPEAAAKMKPMLGAWERILGWARQHGAKVAFGTDLLFQPGSTSSENAMLTRFAKVYGSAGALRIATSGNCELFAASGPRNPYREARIGVVQEGAWADLLLVEGDPTQDIGVLQDHERNLAVIIKDGNVYKNTTAG
ncbi:MAG TPA: amidohydrolase family protein [Anaeromyxobacter sp.]|nr:amidohydrolase family protein [Anaeromyxobacter sp.]